MKVYTKTGDKGTTSLLGGSRVPKSHDRIQVYGALDEVNSWMGVVGDHLSDATALDHIRSIQDDLFTLGSWMASEKGAAEKYGVRRIDEKDIIKLEGYIDVLDEHLPELKTFVLPGGHPANSFSHVARTVCRRAERLLISFQADEWVDENWIGYLNRLSDYLFTLARYASVVKRVDEIAWKPEK